MSFLRLCLLLSIICSCSYLGQADVLDTVIIPVKSTTVESTTPPETTTTESTTTSTTPSTTSTTPSTTSTASTTTSTTSTTSSTSTTTTTPAPTTTTTTEPNPPPTPAPGPLPPPDQGTWMLTDKKTNVTCIVVQFAARLNVTYNKVVENVTSLWNVLLNVPANATVVDGNCTGDQWLKLSWIVPNTVVSNNLTIVYHKNDTAASYGVKSLNISLSSENFVNGSSTDPIELYHGEDWKTPLSTSYRCKMTELNMTSESVSVVATVKLSALQEEAYRTTHGKGFSAARECGGGDVPDAVPIAVGCALGGLVIVVLIAYLVGRRRSAARGYLSM